jgi:hypothetical protein
MSRPTGDISCANGRAVKKRPIPCLLHDVNGRAQPFCSSEIRYPVGDTLTQDILEQGAEAKKKKLESQYSDRMHVLNT